MSQDKGVPGEFSGREAHRNANRRNIAPLPLAVNDNAFTMAGSGEVLDHFLITWLSGAIGKFHYMQINWIILKGGTIYIHMSYGGLIIRGSNIQRMGRELIRERVKEIKQGDVHAGTDHEKDQPFIEEIHFVSPFHLESLIGVDAHGPGYKGKAIQPPNVQVESDE